MLNLSPYKNPQYNLGVADKDAKAISKMFKKQSGKIYKKGLRERYWKK